MSELDPRITAELNAIEVIMKALDTLTDDAVGRVLRYACDRYGVAA